MKKTTISIVVILVTLFAYSCGKSQKGKQAEKVNETEEDHHKNSDLTLNNGKLWTANPETTMGINNMISMMNSFTDKDNAVEYGKLSESLQAEFAMIIQKCTMTGKDHDQLHNFLMPIKNLFDGLSSSNLKECQNSYTELNENLQEYEKFFK